MPEGRFIVFADPPTPNGDLHVGHLSGPYFAADVFVRHQRLRGREVAFLSNFDSNQPYVQTAGRRLGLTPQAVVERFTAGIARSLAAAAIEPDLIGHVDAHQERFVAGFFADLYTRGKLLVKDEEMPYCTHCERYLFEAYLQGTCPNCGATGCFGNGCENCALPHRGVEMTDRICRLCGEATQELRSYRGIFLPLSRYQEELARRLASGAHHYRQPLLDLILPALARPLPDIPLTYPGDYGLPVALPGFEGQVWNVRLEILPALLDTVDKWREAAPESRWDWRATADYEVVCFHGWENGFQYVVSFNALLLATDVGFKLPVANLTNEFYLLEGRKFSTTRNHAVWGTDILSRVSADALRFYLALTNPEETQTDFVLAAFREVTDRRLTGPWNRLHGRLAAALAAAPGTGDAGELPAALAGRLDALAAGLEEAYGLAGFSLRRAADLLAEYLAWLAAEVESAAWPAGPALTGVRAFALFASPLMPRFGARLLAALGGGAEWSAYRRPVEPRGVRWSPDLALAPLAGVDLKF